MMVLKILFTDDEIKTFFEANGYEVEDREFGQWAKEYHNHETYQKPVHPAVIINGKWVKARDLFNRIAEKRMRKYLAPVSLESRRMIENEFKQLIK